MHFSKDKFTLMVTSSMSRGNEVYVINSLNQQNQNQIKSLFGGAGVCSLFLSNLHVPMKLISCVGLAGWDILDLVSRLMWTHDLMYAGSVCQWGERDSQRRRQEASSSDSGLLHVTLTENREGHVGVSGEPDTQTSPVPPPSPSTTISLLMALPHSLFFSQSCFVHLSHYHSWS